LIQRSSLSFSCPLCGRDGCAIGLPRRCAVAPAGGGNAACGQLHLIRGAAALSSVFKPVLVGRPLHAHNFIGTGSGHCPPAAAAFLHPSRLCPQRQSQGLPCGFAKQTKKSVKIGGKACFHSRNSGSFHILPRLSRSQLTVQRRFFVTFLTQESNVLPSFPLRPPLSSSPFVLPSVLTPLSQAARSEGNTAKLPSHERP